MDLNFLVTTLIPTTAVIVVGVILSRQIKSQNEMMRNYKDYISAMDWKEVRDKYEEFKIPELREQYEKQLRRDATFYQEGTFEAMNKVYNQRDDAVAVLALFYSLFPEAKRQSFDLDFPEAAPLVKGFLAAMSLQTPGHKNTSPLKDDRSGKGEET